MTDTITIVGNIAADPKTATTASGVSVVTLRVASDQRRYDRATDKWIDAEPNWFTVSAYRALADHAASSLHKGDRIIVRGRLKLRAWDDGERKGTAVEIDADAIGPELRWGTTIFTRSAAPVATDVAGGDGAETPTDASGWSTAPLGESEEVPTPF